MSQNLKSILTGQGHIREVIVRSQFSEGRADILLEVFPVEAKLFRRGVHLYNLRQRLKWNIMKPFLTMIYFPFSLLLANTLSDILMGMNKTQAQ